jgi:hypothetical protein
MTNQVPVKKLLDFRVAVAQWLQANPDNGKQPIATCIMSVVPEIQNKLTPFDEFKRDNELQKKAVKYAYANEVVMNECDDQPKNNYSAYKFTGEKALEMQKAIKELEKEHQRQEKEIIEQIVEITVSYVSVRPARALIPPQIEEIFTGIVISPDHEVMHNLKIIGKA